MSAALATGVTPAPVAAVQAHQPSASAAAQTSRAGNARQWVQYPFVAGGSRASVLGTITQADLNDMVTLDRSRPCQRGSGARPPRPSAGLSITAADGSRIANAYGNQWSMATQSGKRRPPATRATTSRRSAAECAVRTSVGIRRGRGVAHGTRRRAL